MTALLMPRPRPPADDRRGQRPRPGRQDKPVGRVPTGDVPQAWRGIGDRQGPRPAGTLYGRTTRKRVMIRCGWMALILALAIVGVTVAAVTALLRILVL